jgi:hypothetical protein
MFSARRPADRQSRRLAATPALAHTLKGSARAIGAFGVADAAGHWKQVMASGVDPSSGSPPSAGRFRWHGRRSRRLRRRPEPHNPIVPVNISAEIVTAGFPPGTLAHARSTRYRTAGDLSFYIPAARAIMAKITLSTIPARNAALR